jgi:hypothetical protein
MSSKSTQGKRKAPQVLHLPTDHPRRAKRRQSLQLAATLWEELPVATVGKTKMIGKAKGASLARPTGQNASKRFAIGDKLEEKRVTALFSMVQAEADFAASVELSTRTEQLSNKFKMYK